jgi:hypothetical protein
MIPATLSMSLLLLATICLIMSSEAFLVPSTCRPTSSKLYIGNLFGGLFGQEEQQTKNDNTGPKTVIELPANIVKTGPLKFFLQIYLVGQQNNPVKGAWVLNNNEETGSLNMYYKDGSGMFSLDLNEKNIQVQRFGERASLEYVLQESVMLHGVLDELNQIAFEVDDIEESKRLLQFDSTDAISKARENLPARKAD